MILDCCYSGTATNIQGAKGETSKIKNLEPIFNKNFQNIKDENNKYGAGKFTITSSATDELSWEMKNCIHSDQDTPHAHGVFTYYLIEGLRGGAADPITGEITLLNLHQWIQQKLPKENNQQQPYSASSLATNTNAIRIALSLEQHKKYISDIENDIETYCPQEDSSFPSLLYLIEAIKKLEELKDKDIANSKISIFNQRLASKLEEYKRGVITWCDTLPNGIKITLGKTTGKRDVVDFFSRTVGDLRLDSISAIGDNWSSILDLLGNEVKNNPTFWRDQSDFQLTTFVSRFASLCKGIVVP